jgi:hypothetical protein
MIGRGKERTMSQPAPHERFERLADDYLALPDVSSGTGFGGTTGLRVSGKIFAMLMESGLVLKLPADRCSGLIATGRGTPFTAGKGKPMREWVVLPADAADDPGDPGDPGEWERLVEEAYEFVGHRAAPSRGPGQASSSLKPSRHDG